MILPDINVKIREVVIPIDHYGWGIQIDHRKGRTPERVMRTLGKWLQRWAKRKGQWLINEPRLTWRREMYTDELVVSLKWTACDAPQGETPGKRWHMPEHERTLTYRVFEQ